MPIQIKELVVKTTINEKKESIVPDQDSNINNYDMDNLIQICVEQVLNIIKRSQER